MCVSVWTDNKPAGLFDVCHTHTFGDSPDTSTLFSVHWIWASLYLLNRGHHTTPGKAGPPDYFSSSSTVMVQQQQFVQFLILCSHPEDFQCKVPSQKAEGINAKLVPLSAYNHRCYIAFCTLYTICLLSFKEQCLWIYGMSVNWTPQLKNNSILLLSEYDQKCCSLNWCNLLRWEIRPCLTQKALEGISFFLTVRWQDWYHSHVCVLSTQLDVASMTSIKTGSRGGGQLAWHCPKFKTTPTNTSKAG